MRRCIGAFGIIVGFVATSAGQEPALLAETARFVAGLQNPDGGFGTTPGAASTLGSTSSAIRTLKYCGGSVPDVLKAVEYVKRCHDAASGGFAPVPGGKPDVSTTAIGLMAVAELKLPREAYVPRAIAYFHENVKAFEDVRIAVAGLEAVGEKSEDFPRWEGTVTAGRNPDGTWGGGTNRGRATGGAAAALLRMGLKPDKLDAIVAAIKAGQNADGGWSNGDDAPSDLGSSYRTMRCFFMLKERPELERLNAYVRKHRNSDGGYGPAPGKPSDLSSTYYCSIMGYWSRQLAGEPAFIETVGFTPLFNGRDLSGWEGDTKFWSARDGMIVGASPGIDHNDFLATEKSYGDFVLKASFRMLGSESANSGIMFRARRVPPHEMSGYQADVGQNYWGCLYDESRRNRVLVQANPRAVENVRKGGWNHYVLRVLGNRITLTLNGITAVDYTEPDPGIATEGRVGLQIHSGGPVTVQFKDILIQELPRPVADTATTPGFHLRTARLPSGDRKYSLYVPKGYDGSKAVPLVLFLHGAGERGTDGITPAQVGLGPAIAQRPDFPAIVVFPQARQTWSADSEDARAALAVLDEIMKEFQVARDQVVLTGLSMGGSGSTSIGAAHPERWSAVVPICGGGRSELAAGLKGLPVWTITGDADRDQTVLGLRGLVEALHAAGNPAKLTEYRGVPHNSWDRAYGDPAVASWMFAQRRKAR